ncbi:MAG: cytochrome c oxidase subunit 3 [Deltaproteobacteria bacterium]|nr:cytochrome c oxidase subunit 3 [Deltaproteobacteria bacterium]
MSSSSILNTNPTHEVEQTTCLNVPNHRWGMWWFLGGEVAVFGGILAVFILFRLRNPEWAQEAAHTLTWVGSVNTVILLTSSLTMILAHHFVTGGGAQGLTLEQRASKGALFILLTNLLGISFVSLKIYGYTHEWHAGYTPERSLFWGFYYFMTGLHALHLIAGLVANSVVWVNLMKKRNLQRVESVGIYWHFVDLVWIYLFPLLYLEVSSGG